MLEFLAAPNYHGGNNHEEYKEIHSPNDELVPLDDN